VSTPSFARSSRLVSISRTTKRPRHSFGWHCGISRRSGHRRPALARGDESVRDTLRRSVHETGSVINRLTHEIPDTPRSSRPRDRVGTIGVNHYPRSTTHHPVELRSRSKCETLRAFGSEAPWTSSTKTM
jgi:hypothetical protein